MIRTVLGAMDRPGILTKMDKSQRHELLARGAQVVYAKGDTIFAQGDYGDALLGIETGRVQISTVLESGREVLLGHLGAGDLVGEMALLDGAPRSASVVAASPTTGRLVPFADFEAFLMANPKVMFALTLDLAQKLRVANALAEHRAAEAGAVRLARCLLDLSVRWGRAQASGEIEMREAFDQSTLGQMANLSRENVNRHLRAWEQRGLIRTEGGRLTIVAPDVLTSMVEAG